uniref:Transmembrane protein 132C n=1 Tax=Gadus morhua TaxID=8049 RepID=A0A8C5F8T9_GADMO
MKGFSVSSSFPPCLPSVRQRSADSAYFLRDANQEVMRNGSLSSRTERFFLHKMEGGMGVPPTLPSVNCSYGNLSVEQQIPLELLQGPPPRLLATPSHATLNWNVKGHVVKSRVGSSQPWIQVLFYLAGRRWDEPDPPPSSVLPCVRALAIRDPSESGPSAGCRLVGVPGVCVVRLDLPTAWFSSPQSRKRPSESVLHAVDVYYSIVPVEGPGDESLGLGMGGGQWSPLVDGGLQDMQRVGAVTLVTGPAAAKGERLRLDENLEVLVPPSPVRPGKTVAFGVHMRRDSNVERFTLRAWFQAGINFLAVRPSNLVAWEIKQEITTGSSSLAVLCQRKAYSTAERVDGSWYEVMQLDFEVDNVINLVPTQTLHWQVEYRPPPAGGQSPPTTERATHLYIGNADIQGIVPLAEVDVVNTAILTGRRVSLPVKLVTVETDGRVREVDDSVTCSSTDIDVVKVSPGCDQVLVNGKEMRGRQSLAVNFTYLHLTAVLRLSVWVPRLPLQIHVSDTELSQVKGWRVPIVTNKRPTRDSDDDEDDERKGKGCALQYQYALVRVLTHFVAEPADPGGDMVYMLGSGWQADITDLVLDQLKVEHPRIAKLIEGRILMGRDLGITTIQVLSPLSDSILAEKTVTVLDDKVTITDLGVQLAASLSLSLTASPGGSYQAITLTASATDLLHAPKQEAAITAWIQYSDGSVTPLDIYDPKDFLLSAVSLDEGVISTINQDQRWPTVVAEGEGQGPLVRVEMVISETCQKSKRKSVLASGVGSVTVKWGPAIQQRRLGTRGGSHEEVTHRTAGGKPGSGGGSSGSSSSGRGGGPGQTGDYSSYPAQVEVPGTGENNVVTRGLSDLEIGMYALLGVFCLAIMVFLINCVSFAFRYRHKQLPVLETGGNMNHAHDWVWLGNEADILADPGAHACQGPLPDECTTIIDRSEGGYEENKYLLNGAGGCMVVGVGPMGGHRGRKRVKFTSFATVMPNDGGGGGGGGSPYGNPSVRVGNGNEDDIKWVCQDMDLGQSEIRTYMERLQDNL